MRKEILVGLVVAALFLGVFTGVGLYTDWLWFGSLGFQQVYLTRLVAQAGLFLAGGLIFLAFFAANIALAERLARQVMGWQEYPGSEMMRAYTTAGRCGSFPP